jgi:hypothetical protein
MQKKRNMSEVALSELEAGKIAHRKHSVNTGKAHTTKARNKAVNRTVPKPSDHNGRFERQGTKEEEIQLDEVFALL